MLSLVRVKTENACSDPEGLVRLKNSQGAKNVGEDTQARDRQSDVNAVRVCGKRLTGNEGYYGLLHRILWTR